MFPINLGVLLKKYEDEENTLKTKLQMLSNTDIRSAVDEERENTREYSNGEQDKIYHQSSQTIRKRNAQILKEIEISRARIRSLSLYSPLESVLQNAIIDYIHHLSLNP